MKIGCLGWGSLIWKPGRLPVQKAGDYPVPKDWYPDGPSLPIEFTRYSSGNRITLVLTPGKRPVQSLWNRMLVAGLDQAKRELAIRELGEGEHTEDQIQRFIQRSIGYWTSTEQKGQCADDIGRWASRTGLDAAVWTDLPPKSPPVFQGERIIVEAIDAVPTDKEVIAFLRNRQQSEKSQNAEEYIRKAPRQINTDYRRRIEEDLRWTATGEI